MYFVQCDSSARRDPYFGDAVISNLFAELFLRALQLEGNRKVWESEMEEKMRRLAAAHAEHIDEVVRAQRSLFEIEQKQKVSCFMLCVEYCQL